MYRLSFTSGRVVLKNWLGLKAVLARLRAIARYRQYDLIYMQRELLPLGPPLIERFLRRRGVPMIFDIDDALFIFKSSPFNRLASILRSPNKTFKIFSLVDCVLAGNDYLRDVARRYADDARTFHVAEDTKRISLRPPHRNGQRVTLGWLGSTTTEKYLKLIEEPLREVARQHPEVVLKIVGGGRFRPPGVPVEHVAWTLDSEAEELSTFDIGLMPLPPEEWSKGKSGGKARTYMAAGVPPVCTRIGYNLELIEHGVTGFLVDDEGEWVAALIQLIEYPALRQEIGTKARRHIQENFSVQRQAERLFLIIKEISRNETQKV
jgi:glycosyltransferase involved in cell wall biosynthesis